jgi:hypothetical protein
MKTNLFKVKNVKKEKKKVTLEEEQLYSPLLLLFQRYGCLAVLFFFLLLLIIMAMIVFTISSLSTTHEGSYIDKDLAFEYGDNNVVIGDDSYNDNWIDKYANVYKKEGIIFVVKTFKINGGTVTYYSDESSKLVRDDGSIVRISRLSDGGYGIDENGTINSRSRRKGITITKREDLESGVVIVYYSDGSAEITKGNMTILVRNSERINFDSNKVDIDDISPSGASYEDGEKKEVVGKYTLTYYVDGTILVDDGTDSYVVRNSSDISISGNEVVFPNNNSAKVIKVLTLDDGTVITYYSDGSALIKTFYDTEIMVRKSGDIILNGDDSFWEITSSTVAFEVFTKKTPLGDEVTYYDDGSAIIRYKNGQSVYVEENSNIKYDTNGNIKSIEGDTSSEKKVISTPDGNIITNFDNGKSRVEDSNGNDYIIDTKEVTVDTSGNLVMDENNINKYNPKDDEVVQPNEPDDSDEPEESDGEVTGSIETISDNYYSFVVDNDSKKAVNYKIVLEESTNYSKYGYQDKILSANYIDYDLILGDKYFEGIVLNSNIWTYDDKTNYVLYEGTLKKKDSIEASLYLYVDYADMDNSMQDHLFLGTIKLYIEE